MGKRLDCKATLIGTEPPERPGTKQAEGLEDESASTPAASLWLCGWPGERARARERAREREREREREGERRRPSERKHEAGGGT